jgi:DNA-binding LytR/AlgR family response regulator
MNTIDELEDLLDTEIFYRANRQFLLHINSVAVVKPTYKGLTIVLKSPLNLEIEISREKVTQFKQWLAPHPVKNSK